MDIVDRLILNILVFICKDVLGYDGEKTCSMILKNPKDESRQRYILNKFSDTTDRPAKITFHDFVV